MNLDTSHLILALFATSLIGFSKTGIPGLAMLFVPILAFVFGAKQSVGVLTPMLIMGDVFAVTFYRRHAQWSHLWGLFPFVFAGMIPGFFFLKYANNAMLKPTIGAIVLALLTLELLRARLGWKDAPHTWWFAAVMGFLAGFTTFVGNAAGPIMSLYLLSRGLPKEQFMGTGAWYFMIVNCTKIPFYRILGITTAGSLAFNLKAAPVIVVSALLGYWLLPRIPQGVFNKLVLFLSAGAAAYLIVS
jgi:uncharacterized protein